LTGLRLAAGCLLARIDEHRGVTRAKLAEQIGTSTANLKPSLDQLTRHDRVTIDPGSQAITLTPDFRTAA
jgi:DNA-binding IclR family transcriptional regulator